METTRRKKAERWACTLLLCGGLAFTGGACDKFFEVSGRVVECGSTTQGIADAQGLATAAGYSGTTQFKTDIDGTFFIHMNAREDARVTVTISKPGYADLSEQYDGRPADGDHLQLCMNRS